MLEHRILWRRQIAYSIPLKQRLQHADVGHRFDCEYRLDQPLRLVGAVRPRALSIISRRDIGLDGVLHTAVTRSDSRASSASSTSTRYGAYVIDHLLPIQVVVESAI